MDNIVPNGPNAVNKSSLHLAALQLAAKGIPVFPCAAKGKRPATRNGFKDRSADPATIDEWWRENPDYNIGIVPADQGLAVIDLDGADGVASWAIGYDGEPTRTVATPSGGEHHYYLGSVRPTAGKLGLGIDTRGEDSYVL